MFFFSLSNSLSLSVHRMPIPSETSTWNFWFLFFFSSNSSWFDQTSEWKRTQQGALHAVSDLTDWFRTCSDRLSIWINMFLISMSILKMSQMYLAREQCHPTSIITKSVFPKGKDSRFTRCQSFKRLVSENISAIHSFWLMDLRSIEFWMDKFRAESHGIKEWKIA